MYKIKSILPIKEFLENDSEYQSSYKMELTSAKRYISGVKLSKRLIANFSDLQNLSTSPKQIALTDLTYVYKIALTNEARERLSIEEHIIDNLDKIDRFYVPSLKFASEYVIVEEYIPNGLTEWSPKIDKWLEEIVMPDCEELGVTIHDIFGKPDKYRIRNNGTLVIIDWNECYISDKFYNVCHLIEESSAPWIAFPSISLAPPKSDEIRLLPYKEVKENYVIDWTADLYDKDVTYFFLNNTNQIIAEVILLDEYEALKIDNIECRMKGYGYGTEVVNCLKNYAAEKGYSMLMGESVPDAYSFWTRQGADFYLEDDEEEDSEITGFDASDYDELSPFLIKL